MASSSGPRTTTDRCSSGSIAHFAAKRARRSSRTSRSPAKGSVRSRKSSSPRRTTTSGATIRAFGVRSNASHDSPGASASTSFETMRLRYAVASGPRTATYDRERGAACNVVTVIETRVPSVFRSRAERKVKEAGYDPARLPPGQYLTEKWPVLHAGSVPSYPADLANWDFQVSGEVDNPVTLTWAELNELRQ